MPHIDFQNFVIVCDQPNKEVDKSRLRVDFDISWTDNTINIIPEDAVWNRFVSIEVYEEFFTKLYRDLFVKFKGRPNSETLRREILSFVQDFVKEYQDKGLLT
ncbi:hypothetical protein P10VF_016 [Rhizobium phage vB_RleM_P10VF]|uniref:Uncharacterized protein n=1 Tax=Rhizobium phage vB_RleM_P10VF TaxID=1527770 RepID=A0A076YN46_9CAUD|nr:hypothetical protein P10VF_016 [Rhizobium phage vB_RleM_P10VF]AIK68229.1 hypothetical protein P10VF_016 [Rhizobium phage vB_RleM_P10VF]